MEYDKRFSQNQTKEEIFLLLQDLYDMKIWTKKKTEVTIRQQAKLIEKLNYLRLQLQQASFYLHTIDYKKIQATNLSRLSIFPTLQQSIPKIYFYNLFPRFMSTTRGHGEIAIDTFNQTQKKEFLWIHPLILLLPEVLKKI
ncbi:MAG: hypothetical protein EZS28_018689 [Streblomastix strix]|uniref:Uncharacterized protein n=1 Tax=Streblomastix strix TaxID=222440 RepID=A0A5J4VTA3_9EUKA|nr:MAG: hypothetical protein EZS28_018689 [Streblomastix strix]